LNSSCFPVDWAEKIKKESGRNIGKKLSYLIDKMTMEVFTSESFAGI